MYFIELELPILLSSNNGALASIMLYLNLHAVAAFFAGSMWLWDGVFVRST